MSQGLPRSLFHPSGNAFTLNAPSAVDGAAESRIVNSVFGRNHSAGDGAAINLAAPHSVSVLHNTIVGPDDANLLTDGITVGDGSAAILNTIIGNYTTGIRESGGSVTADYNLFFGNSSNASGSVTLGPTTSRETLLSPTWLKMTTTLPKHRRLLTLARTWVSL